MLSITAKRPFAHHQQQLPLLGKALVQRSRRRPFHHKPSALLSSQCVNQRYDADDTTQLSPTPFQTYTVTCYFCTTVHVASLQSSLHKRHNAVLAVGMGFNTLMNLLLTSVSARKWYKQFSTCYVH